ncbi:BrnA antitoxin family protein [Ciceribacter lividus]|nr:BrnA antitoxin family protein [Ciceribacter lividus]
MAENSKTQPSPGQGPDDAPDLSQALWREKLDAAPVRVGRPKTKVSTTIRLDQDVLERFRKTSPGWQSRINAALRDWLAEKG